MDRQTFCYINNQSRASSQWCVIKTQRKAQKLNLNLKQLSPVRTAHVCVCMSLCTTVINDSVPKNTVLIMFHFIFQTIITGPLLSIKEDVVHEISSIWLFLTSYSQVAWHVTSDGTNRVSSKTKTKSETVTYNTKTKKWNTVSRLPRDKTVSWDFPSLNAASTSTTAGDRAAKIIRLRPFKICGQGWPCQTWKDLQ